MIILRYSFYFSITTYNVFYGYSLDAPYSGASSEFPQHVRFLWRTGGNDSRIITKHSLTSPLAICSPKKA